MKRKLKITGFTIVELITAVSVIAILVGILLPALAQVKRIANNTKQKAQLASIGIGLDMYKSDAGDYPSSHGFTGTLPNLTVDYDYTGAQTLSEAMFGYDLLGVHPDTVYKSDGKDGNNNVIYPTNPTAADLSARRGPYIDRGNIGVFEAEDIFGSNNFISNGLVADRYVICDVFTAANRVIDLPNGDEKTFKVGTPILYFKANNTKTEIDKDDPLNSIYNIYDNQLLIEQGRVANNKNHDGFIKKGSADPDNFYIYLEDPLVSTSSRKRPIRSDTFLLISAGADGLYGTTDDVCNFMPNL